MPRKPAAPIATETALQKSVAEYLAWALPADVMWTAIGHGVALGGTKQERQRRGQALREMGLHPGWPDIILLKKNEYQPPRFIGIELKRASGGVVSPDQRLVHACLRGMGASVYVCRSVAEVEGCLLAEGIALRATVTGP